MHRLLLALAAAAPAAPNEPAAAAPGRRELGLDGSWRAIVGP